MMLKHAKTPNAKPFSWNGEFYKVFDLAEYYSFTVTEEDSKGGEKNSFDHCPGSLGATRCFKQTTLIAKGACFILYEKERIALRGWATDPLREKIIIQDNGGKFPAGEYEIKPPPVNQKTDRPRKVEKPDGPIKPKAALVDYKQGKAKDPATLAHRWGWPLAKVSQFVQVWKDTGIVGKSKPKDAKRAKPRPATSRGLLG